MGWIYDETNKKGGCVTGFKLHSKEILKDIKNMLGPVQPV